MTLRNDIYFGFATRLEQAMTSQSIKHSPAVLAKKFNAGFDGKAVTPHTARNWILGRSFPTQDKLICLAKLLGTSAEQLRYGRHSEKSLMISNSDGTETELTNSQQQLVRKYIMLSTSQQKLICELVSDLLI